MIVIIIILPLLLLSFIVTIAIIMVIIHSLNIINYDTSYIFHIHLWKCDKHFSIPLNRDIFRPHLPGCARAARAHVHCPRNRPIPWSSHRSQPRPCPRAPSSAHLRRRFGRGWMGWWPSANPQGFLKTWRSVEIEWIDKFISWESTDTSTSGKTPKSRWTKSLRAPFLASTVSHVPRPPRSPGSPLLRRLQPDQRWCRVLPHVLSGPATSTSHGRDRSWHTFVIP